MSKDDAKVTKALAELGLIGAKLTPEQEKVYKSAIIEVAANGDLLDQKQALERKMDAIRHWRSIVWGKMDQLYSDYGVSYDETRSRRGINYEFNVSGKIYNEEEFNEKFLKVDDTRAIPKTPELQPVVDKIRKYYETLEHLHNQSLEAVRKINELKTEINEA